MRSTAGAERTARSAQPTFDLIIIGGGILGAWAMWHAVAAGMRVLLIERGELAGGPTGYSTANIRRHYSTPALADIAATSFQFYSGFNDLTGGDAGFVRVGVVLLVASEELSAFEASVAYLNQIGSDAELLDPEALQSLLPGIRTDGLVAAVHEPSGGYADPVSATAALVSAATRRGGTAWVRAPVQHLLIDGDHVRGVHLEDGRSPRGRRVLLCAGPWTKGLLEPLGVKLPLRAERNAIAVLHVPNRSRAVLPMVFSDRPNRYYARPEGDSLLLLGGRTSNTRAIDHLDDYERRVPPTEAAEIVARAVTRLPALEELGIRHGFAGLYDMTPDGLPVIDAVPGIRDIYALCGTSGHGFRLAPGLAKTALELMLDGVKDRDNPFRLDRSYAPTGELTPR